MKKIKLKHGSMPLFDDRQYTVEFGYFTNRQT